MLATILSLVLGSTIATPIQVDGEGYMRFAQGDQIVFAKHTELTWSAGKVISTDGLPVWPLVKVEREPRELSVDLQGHIQAVYSNEVIEVGRLVLSIFPDDIRPVVSGKFLKIYGDSKLVEPGEGLAGVIRPWSSQKAEESYVRVHLDSEESPVKTQSDSITQIKKVAKTDHIADEAWIKNGGIEIAFPDISSMSGTDIKLGDVADIYASESQLRVLAEISLGNAPTFGVPRVLDRYIINSRLKAAGFDVAKVRISGPVRIQIKRVGQTITQQMFINTAIASISEQYPSFEPETTKPVPDLEAPEGTLDLRAEQPLKSGSNLSVTVVAYVDGKRVNSRTLTFVNKSVPLAISNGDTVTVIVISRDVRVESTAKVKKVDRITGQVTVELATGKELVGTLNKEGKVEVQL